MMLRGQMIGVLCFLILSGESRAEAPLWSVDYQQSSITFQAIQMSAAFEGHFNQWRATIGFDPGALEDSTAVVEIDPGSIDTGYDARDTQVQDNEWFDTALHPTATFEVTRFSHLGGTNYAADAKLTLRGTTLNVTMPCSIEINTDADGTAHASMRGTLALDRTAFGIGQGQWATSDTVGKEVIVTVRVEADRGVAN